MKGSSAAVQHDAPLAELRAPAQSAAAEAAGADELWEVLLRPPAESWSAPAGVVIGRLAGHTAAGEPLVEHAQMNGEPLRARSVVAWKVADIGREVVLQFEEGDLRRPIIMGFLQPVQPPALDPASLQAEVDGERLVLSAEKEIVLRCGKASLTLTRAGKVLIRGAYLLSRSSGVNRIKGGSVQIN